MSHSVRSIYVKISYLVMMPANLPVLGSMTMRCLKLCNLKISTTLFNGSVVKTENGF